MMSQGKTRMKDPLDPCKSPRMVCPETSLTVHIVCKVHEVLRRPQNFAKSLPIIWLAVHRTNNWCFFSFYTYAHYLNYALWAPLWRVLGFLTQTSNIFQSNDGKNCQKLRNLKKNSLTIGPDKGNTEVCLASWCTIWSWQKIFELIRNSFWQTRVNVGACENFVNFLQFLANNWQGMRCMVGAGSDHNISNSTHLNLIEELG